MIITWNPSSNLFILVVCAPLSIKTSGANKLEYRRGDQEWTTQRHWAHKTQDDDKLNTKTQYRKFKRYAIRTPPKTGCEPRCSRRVSSSTLNISGWFWLTTNDIIWFNTMYPSLQTLIISMERFNYTLYCLPFTGISSDLTNTVNVQ